VPEGPEQGRFLTLGISQVRRLMKELPGIFATFELHRVAQSTSSSWSCILARRFTIRESGLME